MVDLLEHLKQQPTTLVMPSNPNCSFTYKLYSLYLTYLPIPRWTHNIINLSDSEDLVTVMWANGQFGPKKPDIFGEKV